MWVGGSCVCPWRGGSLTPISPVKSEPRGSLKSIKFETRRGNHVGSRAPRTRMLATASATNGDRSKSRWSEVPSPLWKSSRASLAVKQGVKACFEKGSSGQEDQKNLPTFSERWRHLGRYTCSGLPCGNYFYPSRRGPRTSTCGRRSR